MQHELKLWIQPLQAKRAFPLMCLKKGGFHIFFINSESRQMPNSFRIVSLSPHSSLAQPLLPSQEAGVWIMVTVLHCELWWDCWCIILWATYCHLLAAVGRTNGYCLCTLARDKESSKLTDWGIHQKQFDWRRQSSSSLQLAWQLKSNFFIII